MPFLTLVPRDGCAHCGSRLRGFMMGTYRVNKGSLRANRGSLSWVECPECGPVFARRHPLGVSQKCETWRADPDSQATIDAARARKGWS